MGVPILLLTLEPPVLGLSSHLCLSSAGVITAPSAWWLPAPTPFLTPVLGPTSTWRCSTTVSPTVSPLVPHANPGPSPTQSERGGDTLTRHTHAHARTRTCTHAQGARLGPGAWGTVGPVPSLPHSLFLVTLFHTLAPPPPAFSPATTKNSFPRGTFSSPCHPGPLALLLHVPGLLYTFLGLTPLCLAHLHLSPNPTALSSLCLPLLSSLPGPPLPSHTHLPFPLTHHTSL